MPITNFELPDLPGVRRLWGQEEILAGIRRRVIEVYDRWYQDDATGLVVIGILEGGRSLLDEVETILRALRDNVQRDVVESKLYGDGVRPTGEEPVITRALSHTIRDMDVLIVEDIVDTGRTIAKIVRDCRRLGARSVRVLALCRRTSPAARAEQQRTLGGLTPGVDIVSIFEIETDEFLIGFGLDLAGEYRGLPYVAAFTPPQPPAA